MRGLATAVVALLLGSANGWAQSPAPRFSTTVAATAGGGTTWDDEGRIGAGALLGVRAARRVFANTFLEASLDTLSHERTGRFVAEGRTLFLTASLVQRFGSGTQPYLLGGVTLARHSGTAGFAGEPLVSDSRSRGPGVVFGGGIAIPVGGRFELGPELRFFTVASHRDAGPAFAYWVGGRVGVRF